MKVSIRYIMPIVEGEGEVSAVPILLRRILHEQGDHYGVDVLKPINARGKDGLIKRLEDNVGYAIEDDRCAAILVLLDADRDCPVELGTELARRASSMNLHVPTAVVCAKREYENWFLASDETFEGDAENYGGAKRWLTDRKPPGLIYKGNERPNFVIGENGYRKRLLRLHDLFVGCAMP